MPKGFPQYSYRPQAVARARQVFRRLLVKKLAAKRSPMGPIMRTATGNPIYVNDKLAFLRKPFIGPIRPKGLTFRKKRQPRKKFSFGSWVKK